MQAIRAGGRNAVGVTEAARVTGGVETKPVVWRGWRIVVAALMVLHAHAASALDVYVSPSGQDAAAGTKDAPYATPQRARDAVRGWRKQAQKPEAVTVWLSGGLYELAQPLLLQAQDAGTAQAPVVWRAIPGQTPVLSGARTVGGFSPWKDGILRADATAAGVMALKVRELFCAGKRLTLARYPDADPAHPITGGWAYVDGAYRELYRDVPGESMRELVWKPADDRPWGDPLALPAGSGGGNSVDAGGAEIFIYARFNWWNDILPVAAIDPQKRNATLARDASYAIRPGDRYFIQNLRSELNAPGEWFLDRADGMLYLIPPAAGSDGKQADAQALQVQVPALRSVVRLEEGAANITLRGLVIEHSTGPAVVLKNAFDCRVEGCTIRSAGDYQGNGVELSGGRNNAVFGCDIYDIGRHGILVEGGDPVSLTPAGNVAENNYIHHTGVYYKEGCGIQMYGCGNRAAHNLIHDCPRFAIRFDGNLMTIEYNHARHLSLETCDTGGIYTGCRNWINARGSVIRFNYIHDVIGFGFEHGRWQAPNFGWGIYLDDNSASVDVIGNLVVRAPSGLLHLHSARDCRIENNIFVDGRDQQIQYSGWTTSTGHWGNTLSQMREGYAKIKDRPEWKAIRGMNYAPDDAPLPDGTVMSGNTFEKNIVVNTAGNDTMLRLTNVNFTRNRFDSNLYWNAGKNIDNGANRIGPAQGGNLAPWALASEPGRLPTDWVWQVKPRTDALADVVVTPEGPAVRMKAVFAPEKEKDNTPIIVSKEIALEPGKAYRLRALLRGVGTSGPARLSVQSYKAGGWFWGSWPNEVKLTPQWQVVEFAFRLPGPGDKNYHDEMGLYRARLDLLGRDGEVQVRELTLRAAELLEPWTAWRKTGNDAHSVVADPQLCNLAAGDYRLRPESPAFALGFQPLPLDKIGPYADERRASWPIVEAPGARENPDRTDP